MCRAATVRKHSAARRVRDATQEARLGQRSAGRRAVARRERHAGREAQLPECGAGPRARKLTEQVLLHLVKHDLRVAGLPSSQYPEHQTAA